MVESTFTSRTNASKSAASLAAAERRAIQLAGMTVAEFKSNIHVEGDAIVVSYYPRTIEFNGARMTVEVLFDALARKGQVELEYRGTAHGETKLTSDFGVKGDARDAQAKLFTALKEIYAMDAQEFGSFLRTAVMLAPAKGQAR